MMKTQSNGQLPVASGSTSNEVGHSELRDALAQVKMQAAKQRQESENAIGGHAGGLQSHARTAPGELDKFEKVPGSATKTSRIRTLLAAPWNLSRNIFGRS